jgi:hypothetical protein
MFFPEGLTNLSYISNGAVAFGERVRITIFSVALRSHFEREKNGNWSFTLVFCFFLTKQKENKNKHYYIHLAANILNSALRLLKIFSNDSIAAFSSA